MSNHHFRTSRILRLQVTHRMRKMRLTSRVLMRQIIRILLLFCITRMLRLGIKRRIFTRLISVQHMFLSIIGRTRRSRTFRILAMFRNMFLHRRSTPKVTRRVRIFGSRLLASFLGLTRVMIGNRRITIFLFTRIKLIQIVQSRLIVRMSLGTRIVRMKYRILRTLIYSTKTTISTRRFS